MDLSEESRLFDNTDSRTYPEGNCRIEMEYSDGLRRRVLFSRDAKQFTAKGGSQGSDITALALP